MRVVGLDVHKKFVVTSIVEVSFLEKEDDKPDMMVRAVARRKFKRDWEDLDNLADFIRENGANKVVMESSGPYAHMVYYALEAIGLDVWMAHPRDNKPQNQIKTDMLDAERLAKKFVSGELRAYKLPSDPKLRSLRRLTRLRSKLVEKRAAIKNEIIMVLDEAGLDIKRAFSDLGKGASILIKGLLRGWSIEKIIQSCPSLAKKKEEIERLMKQRGRIDTTMAFILKSLLRLLREIDKHISSVEKQIESVLSEFEEEVRLLTTIPGVGVQLAAVILAEIGGISRFASPKKLASYAGLVPAVYQSGGKTIYGKLRKDCNRRLRWAFYEAGLHAVRFSPRLRSFYERLISRGKKHKQAIIAVGRKIAVGVWHILTKKVPWNENVKQGYKPRQRRLRKISLNKAIDILRELGYMLSIE